MPIQAKTKQVGGATFHLNQLGAIAGLEVMKQIGGIVGAPISAAGKGLSGNLKESVADLELKPETMGEIIGTLLGRIAEAPVGEVAQKLLAGLMRQSASKTEVQGEIDFDSYFAGNYGELATLLAWAIEINFASLFSAGPLLKGLVSSVAGSQK